MSLVSVVIPNYNYARFVGAAVESALSQTHREIEVIVVDNGSTDNSLEVLRKFGDRIRLVPQENRGQSGARNRGIAESKGEWIAFCDADDAWLPEKIERQLRAASRPEVGLVYTGFKLTNEMLQPQSEVRPHRRGNLLSHFADGKATVIPAGESCVMIRRKCFDEVGLFDPELSISAGFDLYRRVCQRFEVEVVEDCLTLYRQHGSNTSRRLDDYARDYFHALGKMFRDPAAAALLPQQRRCLGRAHVSMAGAYAQARQFGRCLKHLGRGIALAPSEIGYVARYPLRLLQRVRA